MTQSSPSPPCPNGLNRVDPGLLPHHTIALALRFLTHVRKNPVGCEAIPRPDVWLKLEETLGLMELKKKERKFNISLANHPLRKPASEQESDYPLHIPPLADALFKRYGQAETSTQAET